MSEESFRWRAAAAGPASSRARASASRSLGMGLRGWGWPGGSFGGEILVGSDLGAGAPG